MKNSDYRFIRRLLQLALVDATKEDIRKLKLMLDQMEKEISEDAIKLVKRDERNAIVETVNNHIYSGRLKIGTRVKMFYNHLLAICDVANVPTEKSGYLKVRFLDPELVGSPKEIKYMPKEYFHSLMSGNTDEYSSS